MVQEENKIENLNPIHTHRRIDLQTDPAELLLHCPFCGRCVYDCDSKKPFQHCPHTKFAGIAAWEEVQKFVGSNDVAFSAFSSDDSFDEHIFVFSEPSC